MPPFCLTLLAVLLCCKQVKFSSNQPNPKVKVGGGEIAAGGTTMVQKIQTSQVDRQLDLLVVVDSSSSMNDVSRELSKSLAPLIAKVQEADWRLVVTSSLATDCLRAVINKNDNEPGMLFARTIDSLIHSNIDRLDKKISLDEELIKMAGRALPSRAPDGTLHYSLPMRADGFNSDPSFVDKAYDAGKTRCTGDTKNPKSRWLREESLLAILLVTDEDLDAGKSCASNYDKCLNDFWDQLIALEREPHVSARIYGLLHKNLLRKYTSWRHASGGQLFDMYRPLKKETLEGWVLADFAELLSEISTNVAEQMKKTYNLDRYHDGKELTVTFIHRDGRREELANSTYQVSGRTLSLTTSPPLTVDFIEVVFSYVSQ